MSRLPKPSTPAEMYDWALHHARDKRLPAGYPKPRPTSEWSPENLGLLGEYVDWLASGGASPAVIRTIYLPMAGHVLGLALKPHTELDLEVDLQRGLEYLRAKELSAEWTDICRIAMFKFRRFLVHRRGLVESKVTPYEAKPHTEGLPAWLVGELERYQRVQQRNWRSARIEDGVRRFWGTHLRVWRFLCEKHAVSEFADVRREHLLDFVDQRLSAGYAVSGINADLRTFHGFLAFLQEQGYAVPQALLRMRGLRQPDRLPKFLTDEQVRLLRDDLEKRAAEDGGFRQRRDALLDRAAFYLLWQSAMRLSEVEELRLEDLDLPGRRLTVRQSKGLKDRTVLLTDTTVRAVQEYLATRGPGPTDHVFLYRNQPVCKDLLRSRIKAAGDRTGVKVHPHRLRHTAATQLLNAGCRVTSIQKLLGHKELNTTMIYARVHDRTVADEYYAVMEQVERQLQVLGTPLAVQEPLRGGPRWQLLDLAEQLAETELSFERRLEIAAQMQQLLGLWQTKVDATMEVVPAGWVAQLKLGRESPERAAEPARTVERLCP
jgi:site-specific recombinase XerD